MLKIPQNFDWQGHRGCRGLMPENTVAGFLEALRYPVTTLELDVVMSKEGELIVSHEPWMNGMICSDPNSRVIPKSESQKHNIHTLTVEEIRQYDCGSKGNPHFPRQQQIHAVKPTLAEVVSEVKTYCMHSRRSLPAFNIEIKSKEKWYGLFVPQPAEFVKRMLAEIARLQIEQRVIVQSFDVNILQELHRQDAHHIAISYLAERQNIESDLHQLGFFPEIYSPRYRSVNGETVRYAHAHGVRVIPWTVNSTKDFRKLIALGVDGIITDYPDLIDTLNLK